MNITFFLFYCEYIFLSDFWIIYYDDIRFSTVLYQEHNMDWVGGIESANDQQCAWTSVWINQHIFSTVVKTPF